MAAGGATLKVDGFGRFRRDLRRMGADLKDLKAANAAVAQLVARAAGRKAPRRTGRLARTVRGNRAAGRATVSAGGAATPYAGPIHWGWEDRHIAAQPFVRDAGTETQATWLPIYERDLERVVDSAMAPRY